jgi:hypothetical protein
VHADDAVGVRRYLRRVGDVPEVEHDPDGRRADQLERILDRVHERERVRLRRVHGLERDLDAAGPARVGDGEDPVAGDVAGSAGPRQEDDAHGIELREPPHARAERVDPSRRVLRALHQRQRQDRRHRRDAMGGDEAALAQPLRGVLPELELADADAADARRAVRREIFGEGRRQRRELADRDAHEARLNRRR